MHCCLISMKKTMTLPLIFVFNWSISTDSIKDNRQSTLLNLTTHIENMEINVFVIDWILDTITLNAMIHVHK